MNTTFGRASMLGPFPLPSIDDPQVQEQARHASAAGRQWLAFEDPATRDDQPTPRAALQGAYELGPDGQLTGRYQVNPQYRPSEHVAGMPLNTVEVVLWRALHGYNPAGLLADTLYRAELAIYAEHDGDDRIQVARDSEGRASVPAFTSARHIPAEWSHHQRVPAWTLIDSMASEPVHLALNPGTSLALTLLVHDLAALLTDRSTARKNQGPIPLDD